ncbi:hypothetical protein [Pseudomonas simiae]|uniref:hypothetical protein n=1 Tax=Pseudomonas simiae TaxID=321846 RepID=UPI0011B1CDEF|nr:hypothetical protein [Pseudomonas simiae]
MELILAIAILWLLFARHPTKPLSEQNSSELAASEKSVDREIEKHQRAIKDAEYTMIEKRESLNRIENNLQASFKIDRSVNRLLNIAIGTVILIVIMMFALITLDPNNIPYWLHVHIEHNRKVFGLLASTIALFTVVFIVSLFILIFEYSIKFLVRRKLGIEEIKYSPIEKYINSKRETIRNLELEHSIHLENREDSIKDLRVKKLEIIGYADKRRKLKKSL